MKTGESVNDYFSRTLAIANKMRPETFDKSMVEAEEMEAVVGVEEVEVEAEDVQMNRNRLTSPKLSAVTVTNMVSINMSAQKRRRR